VYDSGGNGYLATVYYAKTQNASQDQTPPSSKWQTYFFVGDTQVKPALQQATDKVGGVAVVAERLICMRLGIGFSVGT
jgi:hypothetical protein